MIKQDKQPLLKDLCARLPYFPMVHWRNTDVELTPVMLGLYINEECKPYLRSMSSMTEEECKELGDLPAIIENVGETLPNIPYYIEVARPEQLDWLNANHFDYRGLIKMGLALEAPEGMYES